MSGTPEESEVVSARHLHRPGTAYGLRFRVSGIRAFRFLEFYSRVSVGLGFGLLGVQDLLAETHAVLIYAILVWICYGVYPKDLGFRGRLVSKTMDPIPILATQLHTKNDHSLRTGIA